MPIRFTNTLTSRKEDFHPLKPPQVTMYVCGVTVYDDCHIGHARGAVVFDTLRRFLLSSGCTVRHVRNITDLDDKIIDRAKSWSGDPSPSPLLGGERERVRGNLKVSVQVLSEFYTQRFQEDFRKLGLLPPHEEPKATDFIPQMIAFIQELAALDMAYEAGDGVYFSVRKLKEYGRLSRQKPDQMMENTRVDAGAGKKDPLDFALWKKAKPDEPSWPSPWGEGRPGWHIECSAMSTRLLGDTFDIHGGGQDLVFPHHENELAQALGAGKKFARFWLHNGLLTVNGQKMSKSLGNFVTIRDALEKHPADVLRLFFLSAHYRSPQDFTWEHLDEAAHAYERLHGFLAHAEGFRSETVDVSLISKIEKEFGMAMEDDLNTPRALAALYKLVPHPSRAAAQLLCRLGAILGFFWKVQVPKYDTEVQKLMDQRDEARRRKDFSESDRIRKQLLEMGYVVEDTVKGTVWRPRV